MQEAIHQQRPRRDREEPPAPTMLDALMSAVKDQNKGHTKLGKQVSQAARKREERKFRKDDWR